MFVVTFLLGLGSIILPAIGVGLAIFADIYIKPFGKAIAITLFVLSAGLFSWGEGYRFARQSDQTDKLRVELSVERENARLSNQIIERANKRAEAAEHDREQAEKAVTDYETQLSKQPALPECRLTSHDVDGLRSIYPAPKARTPRTPR